MALNKRIRNIRQTRWFDVHAKQDVRYLNLSEIIINTNAKEYYN